MLNIDDSLPNLNAITNILLELRKDLESQIMYHEAAEGFTYYQEKPLLDKARKHLRLVNDELLKREENEKKFVKG